MTTIPARLAKTTISSGGLSRRVLDALLLLGMMEETDGRDASNCRVMASSTGSCSKSLQSLVQVCRSSFSASAVL